MFKVMGQKTLSISCLLTTLIYYNDLKHLLLMIGL